MRAAGTVVLDVGGGSTVPSLLGLSMREAIETAHKAGFELQVVGSGTAREQQPPPGCLPAAGLEDRSAFRALEIACHAGFGQIAVMNFLEILDGAEVLSQSGGDCAVKGLDYDSRRVQPAWVFVAMRGESTDGNRYIDAAIAAGAVAVVTDSADEIPRDGVAWAVVPHGRRALARLSANFYKRPAERLRVTGMTGTNGKTTTTFIVEAILQAAGRKNALVGTVEYHLPGEILPAPHTTPESLELNRMLARALARGATEAVMEVSSHALQQARVFGIPFDVAVFSNLTQDHLDYHGTMEDYFAAKRILFEGCGTEPPRCAIVNLDDEYGRRLAEFSRRRSQVFTYGIEQGDFHAEHLEMTPHGNNFALTTPDGPIELRSPLIGRVNVYNVLAACAAAYARGCTRGADCPRHCRNQPHSRTL